MEAIATARTSPAKIDTVTVPMRTCSDERFGVGVGGGRVGSSPATTVIVGVGVVVGDAVGDGCTVGDGDAVGDG